MLHIGCDAVAGCDKVAYHQIAVGIGQADTEMQKM